MGDKSTDNKFIGREIVIELLKDVPSAPSPPLSTAVSRASTHQGFA